MAKGLALVRAILFSPQGGDPGVIRGWNVSTGRVYRVIARFRGCQRLILEGWRWRSAKREASGGRQKDGGRKIGMEETMARCDPLSVRVTRENFFLRAGVQKCKSVAERGSR